jgi:hypothetical protein
MITRKIGRYNQEIIEFSTKQDYEYYRSQQSYSFFMVATYHVIIVLAIIGARTVLLFLIDRYIKFLERKSWK